MKTAGKNLKEDFIKKKGKKGEKKEKGKRRKQKRFFLIFFQQNYNDFSHIHLKVEINCALRTLIAMFFFAWKIKTVQYA